MGQDPSVTEIFNQTRALLGDDNVSPDGEVFTNAKLLPHLQAAYRDLQRGLRSHALLRPRREGFIWVPANSSQISPQVVMPDFLEPISIEDRRAGTSAVPTALIDIDGQTLQWNFAGPHGFLVGQQVDVMGILTPKGVNCSVTVSAVPLSGQFQAVCQYYPPFPVTPTFSAFARVVYSSEPFVPVGLTGRVLDQHTAGPQDLVRRAEWIDRSLRFSPVLSNREFRITYYSADLAPSIATDRVGLDDSLEFMSSMTAFKAGRGKVAYGDMVASLLTDALGPGGTVDKPTGGYLKSLIDIQVKLKQRKLFIRPRFRASRQFI